MGRTNRGSRTGCATRLNCKNAKYIQTLLQKVHYETPVPFGQDRLIPVWVATLAVLQKSRLVRFACPSQMLDYFELPKNGYHYTRIVQGFQRIFGATIFFGTEEQRKSVGEFIEFLTGRPGATPQLETSPRSLVANAVDLSQSGSAGTDADDPLLELLRTGNALDEEAFVAELQRQRTPASVSQ